MSSKEVRPKLTIQPSKKERRETMETLTEGKPVDESVPSESQAPPDANEQRLDRTSVEPGVGIIKQSLHPNSDTALGDDEENQRDGRADLLPR